MENPAPVPSRSTTNLSNSPRYWFFISYSHTDLREASRIQRSIESFAVPFPLRHSSSRFPSLPKKPTPVFRDRDALASSHDLSAEIRTSLAASANLLVVCSRASARSEWVAREVVSFLEIHGPESILCLVVDGEPNAADPALECLPPPLRRQHFGRDILAADLRPEADGRRQALLKILAGGLALPYERLAARESRRATRRAATWIIASLLVALGFGALAFHAEQNRRNAEREATRANLIAEYLTSVFFQFLPRKTTNIPNAVLIPFLNHCAAPERLAPLESDPNGLIHIRNLLATAFYQLDLSKRALNLYEENLQLARSAFAPDSGILMECLVNVANASAAVGDDARAEQIFRDLLDSTAADPERFRLERVTIVSNLAAILGQQNRRQESLDLYEKHKASIEFFDPSEIMVLYYRANHANQLLALGHIEESVAILRDVVQKHLAARGPEHGDTLHAKHQLANALGAMRHLDEAETLFREILEPLANKFGRDNGLTLGNAFKLVCLLHMVERREEACVVAGEYFGTPPDPELVKRGSGPGESLPPCP